MKLGAGELLDFLERLRLEYGFTIGIREMLRAEHVRSLLSGSAEPFDLDGWAMHISPVVCGSQEEQIKLRVALREHCGGAISAGTAAGGVGEIRTSPRDAPNGLRRGRTHLYALVAAVVVALLVSAVWWWWLPPVDRTRTDRGDIVEGSIPVGREPSRFGQHAVAIGIPWVLLAVFLLWRSDRQPAFIRRLASTEQKKRVHRFGSHLSKYFQPAQVARHLRSFQLRWPRGSRYFAAQLTVREASQRAGYAEPQFLRRTTAPEYLVMIRQRGRNDHASAIGLELAALLESAGVPVETFVYVGYPAQLMRLESRPGSDGELGPARPLEIILDEHSEAVTIVVDDGSGLVDPLTLVLSPEATTLLSGTRLTAVLSPAVADSWGWRERALDNAGLLVVPCDASGVVELSRMISDFQRADVARVDPLVYAAERRFERQTTSGYPALLRAGSDRYLNDDQPPPEMVAELLEELKRYLGPTGFAWLGALAVYPVIQPDLTRELGARLAALSGRAGFNAQTYLALARLPWVTNGRMPDWLRRTLLKALPVEVGAATRGILQSLLSEPRVRGPVTLDINIPESLWRNLTSTPRAARRHGAAARDAVFVQFMTTGSRPLLVPAPEWLERLLRPKLARWVVMGVAVSVAAALSAAALLIAARDLDNSIRVAAVAAPLILAAWHLGSSHVPNDVLPRSGVLLAALTLLGQVLLWWAGGDYTWPHLGTSVLLIVATGSRALLQAQFTEDRTDVIGLTLAQSRARRWVAAAVYLMIPAGIVTLDYSRSWKGLAVLPGVDADSGAVFGVVIVAILGYGLLAAVVSGAERAVTGVFWAALTSSMFATLFAGILVTMSASYLLSSDFEPMGLRQMVVMVAALVVFDAISIRLLSRRIGIHVPLVVLLVLLIQWSCCVYFIKLGPGKTSSLIGYTFSPLMSLPLVAAMSIVTGIGRRAMVMGVAGLSAALSLLIGWELLLGPALMLYSVLVIGLLLVVLRMTDHATTS